MIAYKTKHFTIKELVHPWVLKALGEVNCWLRLDSLVLEDLDTIREEWGSGILINSGRHDSRGLRPPNDPDGAWYSIHKHGKAFDLVPVNGDYQRLYVFVRELIISGRLKAINTLEDVRFTKGWVHVARMNTFMKPFIVKP